MNARRLVMVAIGIALVALSLPSASAATGAHYLPKAGDGFGYEETNFLTNGVGNYTGYSESSFYNGTIDVTSVLPNGTDSATYASSGTYRNNQGQSSPWSESGSFTFSATTYLYVQGTDNQTGYTNPYVWFYVNSSVVQGSSVTLLNTPMNVVSTDTAFASALGSTGYVQTALAEGNGSYQRHDSYGTFTASYNWKAYFDPATGYIVGYVYSESDSDGVGDGFTWTDTLWATHTTYPLTSTAAPPPPPASASSSFPWLALIVVLVILVVVVVVVALALRIRASRARGIHAALPQHPIGPAPAGPPLYAPPPPLDLIPHDQPTPQVVLRETVKVPCRFCGTLIDSTVTNCPKCGAPRT